MNTQTSQNAPLPEKAEKKERALTNAEYQRFLPLVRRTAMRVARRVPSHITVQDLTGYGWVGLLEAFRRASPDMPTEEFEAYALYRVRGAMLDHLRAADPVTRASRATSRRLTRTVSDLQQKLGREPEEKEIAEAMGLSEDKYRNMLIELDKAGMTRLELVDLDRLDGMDSEIDPPEESASRRELGAVVSEAIKKLPERLQHVLALYYIEELKLREIGEVLEVSEARVCQLHAEAVHRIRASIGRD